MLGGLLGAHHISEKTTGTPDPVYLEKAQEFGDRLLAAFSTTSGLPTSSINIGRQLGIPDPQNNGLVSTAEAATLQLELKYLSHLTGDEKYWRAAEKVMMIIKNSLKGGLAPIMMQ